MTRKKREHLRLAWVVDREAMGWKARHASDKADWQFLIQLGEALKPREAKKYIPLHVRIQSAYEDLCSQTLGRGVTTPMLHNFIDPQRKISRHQFRVALRKTDIRLPHGQAGRPKKLKK